MGLRRVTGLRRVEPIPSDLTGSGWGNYPQPVALCLCGGVSQAVRQTMHHSSRVVTRSVDYQWPPSSRRQPSDREALTQEAEDVGLDY